MVRDDLYITVPSYFRCPISLDVMKSPVSLCTGVTYDRASIQRWLDCGNNTCPATMQVLQSKDFVPNLNLQRLIQIWSDSVVPNRHEDDRVDPARSRDQVRMMVRDIKAGRKETSFLLDAFSRIASFSKESDENCRFVAKLEGLVPMLVDLLGNGGAVSKRIDLVEGAVDVLATILIKIGDDRQLMSLFFANDDIDTKLSSLFLVLSHGRNVDIKTGAVKILQAIALNIESKVSFAEKDGLLSELVKAISLESDHNLTESCLSCLVAISKQKPVRVKLVQLKIIKRLTNLLVSPDAAVSVTEKALKLLETVLSCREGRAEVCGDEECVKAVMQKVLKVSGSATEHAVIILWSVCYAFRDKKAREVVIRGNGLTKILLLMQSNCSPGVRQMSADLLRIFRLNSKNFCLPCYDTKTTHIMPF